MKSTLSTISIMLIIAVNSRMTFAADWNVDQTTSIAAESPSLIQHDTNVSFQAINGIALDVGNDDLSNSNQTTTLAGNNIAISQTGTNTSSSVQALNSITAHSMRDISQSVAGFNTVAMTQTGALSGGNIQAFNYAHASTTIENLSQSTSGAEWTVSNGNIGSTQAVNYAQANRYTGSLEQSTILTTVNAAITGGLTTRINSVQGSIIGLSTPIMQSARIGTLNIVGRGTVIINHVAP
ncbi:hypothetical protein [Arenicella xantha]|uniref:Uncharacterized protein n=1 Tax=Arenicella xantha TaxID=644221 RepID=A0A395JN40_9GAMM|nr:hypothetical protein [Arenicella xantha]RBP51227.1 hypothetical protein DFR28_102646 [Arenicella xantha]